MESDKKNQKLTPEEKKHLAELGRRIASAREYQKLSQVELAGLANTTQAVVSKIEAGKTNPRYATLLRIAAALKLNIDTLLAPPAWINPPIVSSGIYAYRDPESEKKGRTKRQGQ